MRTTDLGHRAGDGQGDTGGDLSGPGGRSGGDDTEKAGGEELPKGTNFEALQEYAPLVGVYFFWRAT